jgi:hypothetical protein
MSVASFETPKRAAAPSTTEQQQTAALDIDGVALSVGTVVCTLFVLSVIRCAPHNSERLFQSVWLVWAV